MPKPVESVLFTKPPRTSWWMGKTREELNAALDGSEGQRMKQEAKASVGEQKVVGSHYGRV